MKNTNAKDKLVNKNYQRDKLFKKAINNMADEKIDNAIDLFEKALRLDPKNVDILLKLGYAKFHIEDYHDAIRIYDEILEIDVTNPDAWNLKALVYYKQKNYQKALNCVDKSIESDTTYGMAWYNKACFHSILNQITEAIDALKRSIEIDVKNAKKAVKDKDFMNVKIDEGFRRIVEVVVLESIRQGYHTIGAIVWTTFISKNEIENALLKLLKKGFIIKNEKRQGLQKIPIYDLIPEMAKKINTKKKLMSKIKEIPSAINNLKKLEKNIYSLKTAIEEENIPKTISQLEYFIDPTKYGQYMIEEFLEEHREMRLWRIRLEKSSIDYLHINKKKMCDILNEIEITITKRLRNKI